jgi:ATP-binding cassette subfamily B protein
MIYFSMLKNLLKYAKGERWKIAVYYIFHIISICGTLLQPYAFAMVINALQRHDEAMIHDVQYWLIIYVVGFLVFNIFHRSARFMERYVAFRARKRFITTVYGVLQSLPLSWHEENHTGNVIDRINKAADGLYWFGECQAVLINMIINFVGATIILARISIVIAVIALLAGAGIIFITKSLYKISVPEYRKQVEGFHNVSATLFDYIRNITTIIVLKLGKSVQKKIDEKIEDIFPHVAKENKITQLKCFLNELLVVSLNVGLIFYYINSRQKAGGIVMAGSITAIFQYLGKLMESVNYYATDYENVIHWNTALSAVEPILNAKAERQKISDKVIDNWNDIKIGPVNHSYGIDKAGLHNVCVELNKGKKIAFIGESGAGKSTMLKIMSGLIGIPDQKIVIDNNVEEFETLENMISFIPQEPEIFENTIIYNITMGLPAEDEAICKFAKMACFDKVAEKLDKKYETDIRENGVNLSGGEKQRLALARGFFAIQESSIILMDEPTSSLDPATELEVYTNIMKEMKDRCIVSVLHRLHLLNLFDYIYVFKNGKIVEEGEFDTLVNKNGELQRMWNEYQVDSKEIVE